MASKQKFRPEIYIATLNGLILPIKNKTVTKSEMFDVFKQVGLPANNTFWMFFRSEVLKRVKKRGYCFKNQEPIHLNTLDYIHHKYNKYLIAQSKKQHEKNKRKIENQTDIIEKESADAKRESIAEAIKLLKENGYLVFKQIVSYEQI